MCGELIKAVNNNDIEQVRELLKDQDLDINAKYYCGNEFIGHINPLHTAVIKGHNEIIKLLLEHPKIDVDTPSSEGETALYIAAKYKQVDACRLLLPICNPLGIKGERLPYNVAKDMLVQSRDEINREKAMTIINLLRTPTFICSCRMGDLEQIHQMIEEGQVDINGTYTTHENVCLGALKSVCLSGRMGTMWYLLSRPGLNVNWQDNKGQTVLHSIYLYELPACPQAKEASKQVRERLGFYCKELDRIDLTREEAKRVREEAIAYSYFLDDPKNTQDRPSVMLPSSLLHPQSNAHMIADTRERMVRALIKYGADVDACDKDGRTPLLNAVMSNSFDLVKVLVEEGQADLTRRYYSPSHKDQSSNIFELAAHRNQHPEIYNYLKEVQIRGQISTPTAREEGEFFKRRGVGVKIKLAASSADDAFDEIKTKRSIASI